MVEKLAKRLPRTTPLSAIAIAVALWLPILALGQSPAEVTDPRAIEFFETSVRSILQANCFDCHGGKEKIKGDLRLTHRDWLLKGGSTGPAISLDDPAGSLLLRMVNYADDDHQMPPKEKLPQGEIDVLSKWVMVGAPWPAGDPRPEVDEEPDAESLLVTEEAKNFWSFRPVARPEAPEVKDEQWARNPIDAFILSRLEENGLAPNPPADKTELLRRAYYGLTGLPPTPEEVDAFVADASPGAYEKVLDRLLDSPHYGEQWGRQWLDLVRYAETNSFERDNPKANVWRYRDYVIDAFNKDKPYARFILEQLAGDELDKPTAETMIATGYYRLGQWDDEPTDVMQAYYDELDDIVATTGQVFLGLSMNCARCHEHKNDPIPQEDYYRFLSFFHGVKSFGVRGEQVKNNQESIASPRRIRKYKTALKTLASEKKRVLGEIVSLEKEALSLMSEEERIEARDRNARRKLFDTRMDELLGAEVFTGYQQLYDEIKALNKTKLAPPPQALCVEEDGPIVPPTYLLIRGNASSPGAEVFPAFPSVLGFAPPRIPMREDNARSSGRRLALAEWLGREDNQLTARVMVNRIWQRHFGRGIVRSPNDFGFKGDRPTHPELLDWLASEFMDGGWRIKRMQKMIMMSAAYRMSSRGDAKALEADPENDLFWRMNMRRLGAEEIRDSILMANGSLNLKMGGPSIYPEIPEEVLAGQSRPGKGWPVSSRKEQNRRSVYIHVKRSMIYPMMASFDFADTDSSCPVRFSSTQPTQALSLLNSEFSNKAAGVFAKRLSKAAKDDPAEQVSQALRLTTSRAIAPAEIERGTTFMQSLREEYGASESEALQQFCLLALNLNEFVYLD